MNKNRFILRIGVILAGIMGTFVFLEGKALALSEIREALSYQHFYKESRHHTRALKYLDSACQAHKKQTGKDYRRGLKDIRKSKDEVTHRSLILNKRYKNRLIKIDAICTQSKRDLKDAYAQQKAPHPPAASRSKKQSRKKTNKKSPPATINHILKGLKKDCADRAALERNLFYQFKRELDPGDSDRRKKIKQARQDLKDVLNRVKSECQEAEVRIRTVFRNKSQAEARAFRDRMEEEREEKKRLQKEQKEPALDWRGFIRGLAWDQWRINGNLKQEMAYRTDTPNEFTKIKTQLLLSESVRINDKLRFKFSQRAYFDSVFNSTENFPDRVEDDQESDLELREAFFDYSVGNYDLRTGKQQIVWGETVGLFVADVVHGRDLRDYILPEFDLIRIPQWAIDLSMTKNAFHSEWIATLPEFDKLGVPGAEFAFPLPVPAGTAFTITDPDEPNGAEVGGRISYLLGGLDLGAFYFYGWDKTPILFRTIDINGFHFSPEYKRKNILGATFSKDAGQVILKGEMTINPNQYLSTTDLTDTNGVTKETVINSVLGMDYTFFDQLETNLQFLHRRIPGADDSLVNEKEARNHISVWLKRDFFNGKLEPELLAIVGLTEHDNLIRPKVGINTTRNTRLKIGFDFFDGKKNTGYFGIFKSKDRFFVDFEYFF